MEGAHSRSGRGCGAQRASPESWIRAPGRTERGRGRRRRRELSAWHYLKVQWTEAIRKPLLKRKSFEVPELWSWPHSVVYGVTVAIFVKMRNLQFCLLLWLSNDAPRPKKVVEPNRTSGRCAGAACQLLPGGDWRKFEGNLVFRFKHVISSKKSIWRDLNSILKGGYTKFQILGCAGIARQLLPEGIYWKSAKLSCKMKSFSDENCTTI